MKPKPVYLLAGGRRSWRAGRDPLLERVFRETGKAAPTVAYVGIASDDDRGFFERLAGMFRGSGAGEVALAPLVGARDVRPAVRVLKQADCVFISGGDVELGMEGLDAGGLTGLLADLHREGVLFFGLSAGSIMLAQQWVRWRDEEDDSSAEVFPCLGLAPVLCDVHDEADGWEELHALLHLCRDGSVGYGIPGGAGLRVSPDGTVEALGETVACFTVSRGRVVSAPDLPAEDGPGGG